MYPPKIEYETPYAKIQIALPCNMSRDGNLLKSPLPQEADIRQRMITFTEEIRELFEFSESNNA